MLTRRNFLKLTGASAITWYVATNVGWTQRAIAQIPGGTLDPGDVTKYVTLVGTVMAHGPSLTQCLSNLLENALKFARPGEPPRVEVNSVRRDGRHTAPSNEAFDRDLRRHDPAWGIRDLEAVAELAAAEGFAAPEIVEMPANNLSVVLRKT